VASNVSARIALALFAVADLALELHTKNPITSHRPRLSKKEHAPMNTLQYLMIDESAEILPEYALLLALLAVLTVISITALRTSIIGTVDPAPATVE
jgi:Flp pilus assembly pilin Flp